jgi:hypothetical protein
MARRVFNVIILEENISIYFNSREILREGF